MYILFKSQHRTMKKHTTTLLACFLACAPAFAAQQSTWSLFGGSAPAASTPDKDFVHPVSSPYYDEHSFVTNDVRGWAVYQKLPSSLAVNPALGVPGNKLSQGGS